MKHPVTAFTRLLSVVVLSTLIAACGSGGGDDDDGGGGNGGGSGVPSDTFRITCKVITGTDAASVKPVEGALVTFNVKGITPSPSTSTGSDGECVPLDLKAADLAGLTEVAASVVKPGFEPKQFTCPITTAGTQCNGAVVLVPLAANTSVPGNGNGIGSANGNGNVVMHIGDDFFEGEPNSQFQKKTDGPFVDFAIGEPDWGSKIQAGGWTRATVVLEAKGWQTRQCANGTTTTNTVLITGVDGSQSKPGAVSRLDGTWTESKFEFDLAQIGKTGAATLRIESAICSAISTDIDDVETNSIRIYFCDATTVGECKAQP